MQMNTSNGWHGGHLEEDLKEALRRLIQKGEIFLFTALNLIGKSHLDCQFDIINCEIINNTNIVGFYCVPCHHCAFLNRSIYF